MKRIAKLIFVFLFILTVVGCSQNSLTGKEEVAEGGIFVSLDSNIDLNAARDIAMAKIVQVAGIDSQWEDAEISESFLWYNPMVTVGPAYVEYKVISQGADQGYVMVSLTDLDFQTPEYHTEGKPMYEYLQRRAGTIEVKGIKFSPFAYAGEYVTRNGVGRVYLGTLEHLNNIDSTRSVTNEDVYDSFLNVKNNHPPILFYNDSQLSANHFAPIYQTVLYRDRWNGRIYSAECSIVMGQGDAYQYKTIESKSEVFYDVITVNIWK